MTSWTMNWLSWSSGSATVERSIDERRWFFINPNADLTHSNPSGETEGTDGDLNARDLESSLHGGHRELQCARGKHSALRRTRLQQLRMTTISTSGHDPLRDEVLALARQLRRDERLTSDHHLAGMVHGVINLDTVSPTARRLGDQFLAEFAADLIQSKG